MDMFKILKDFWQSSVREINSLLRHCSKIHGKKSCVPKFALFSFK